MRRSLVPLLCLLGTLAVVAADVARARPFETFVLARADKIIAENPGCHASCVVSGVQRTCTVKTPDCRPVCTELPECRPDGAHPVKVCAIVRESR